MLNERARADLRAHAGQQPGSFVSWFVNAVVSADERAERTQKTIQKTRRKVLVWCVVISAILLMGMWISEAVILMKNGTT